MRIAAVGILVTVAALSGAATAKADTQYGGVARVGVNLISPDIALLRRDDGSIAARLAFGYGCRRVAYYNNVARLRGHADAQGGFTASGHTKLPRFHRLRFSLKGTFSGAAATGTVRLRVKGCRGYTRKFVLHAAAAPAGAPTMPPAHAALFGVTSQSVSGMRLPISLRVTGNGKLTAQWEMQARCHRGTTPIGNVLPFTKIRPDGSFSRSERYSLRYDDGSRDVFRVSITGHFVPGGAVGTLHGRVHYHDGRHRYFPCATGVQQWSATM